MNKNELIASITKIKNVRPLFEVEGEEDSYFIGRDTAYQIAINEIEKLDMLPEPEKITVPQWFDDWYKGITDYFLTEHSHKALAIKIINQTGNGHRFEDAYGHDVEYDSDDVFNEIYNNREKYTRAILDEYTVDQGSYWVVYYVGDTNKCFVDFKSINGLIYGDRDTAIKFENKEKANAVALLTDGKVDKF